jgi:hypothetical protein
MHDDRRRRRLLRRSESDLPPLRMQRSRPRHPSSLPSNLDQSGDRPRNRTRDCAASSGKNVARSRTGSAGCGEESRPGDGRTRRRDANGFDHTAATSGGASHFPRPSPGVPRPEAAGGLPRHAFAHVEATARRAVGGQRRQLNARLAPFAQFKRRVRSAHFRFDPARMG